MTTKVLQDKMRKPTVELKEQDFNLILTSVHRQPENKLERVKFMKQILA